MFEKLLESIDRDSDQWEVMEELMALRADLLIHHAIDGFGGTYEDAIDLLRHYEDLTVEQEARRNVILAAVDNLIDFAVAEEYQMAMDLPGELEGELEDEELDEDEEDDSEEFYAIFTKYNKTYASTEDLDVEYAMIVAAGLYGLPETTILTYMTQGDERVRPWHLQYEGYSAPKSRFPGWLVPPIEHGCRCFLVEDDILNAKLKDVVNARVIVPSMPFWFNPTFKESVAFGGRIFSDEHPYFQVREEHRDRLTEIANRIKDKYLNG